MSRILKYMLSFYLGAAILSSCVSVEKRHCDSSKKGNKRKMKKLRSGGGFNMGAIIKPTADRSL